MSRIGKLPVAIPSGVNAALAGAVLKVKGPKGELALDIVPELDAAIEGGQIKITPKSQEKYARAQWGRTRTMIANMVTGVTQGFTKNLELQGVGYRAAMQGTDLKLSLGFSHDVIYAPPAGIKIEVPKQTEIKISGIDKQVVGQTAAVIRSYRPPEPYKGKGVRLAGEYVRRKEGKKK